MRTKNTKETDDDRERETISSFRNKSETRHSGQAETAAVYQAHGCKQAKGCNQAKAYAYVTRNGHRWRERSPLQFKKKSEKRDSGEQRRRRASCQAHGCNKAKAYAYVRHKRNGRRQIERTLPLQFKKKSEKRDSGEQRRRRASCQAHDCNKARETQGTHKKGNTQQQRTTWPLMENGRVWLIAVNTVILL
jgi:hypothetical protein